MNASLSLLPSSLQTIAAHSSVQLYSSITDHFPYGHDTAGPKILFSSDVSLILAMCSQILKDFKYLQALFQLISLVSLIIAFSNLTEGFILPCWIHVTPGASQQMQLSTIVHLLQNDCLTSTNSALKR